MHLACFANALLGIETNIQVVQLLIDIGGKELVMQKNKDGEIALHKLLRRHSHYSMEVTKMLLRAGIGIEVEVEDKVGGLFLKNRSGKTPLDILLYSYALDVIIPVIQDIIQGRPILQVAITENISTELMKVLLAHFDWCIEVKDSMGRLPIEFALARHPHPHLDWQFGGLRDIFEATVAADVRRRSPIVVASLYGLRWDNGMKIIADEDGASIGQKDVVSGLYPAMLAASGGEKDHVSGDLSSIYELLRRNPTVLE